MDILVVDDDAGTCETLAIGLQKLGGHEVATAISTDDGLALARSRAFDVALIDQRLGPENGLDFLLALRRTRSAHAAAYILTAWGTIPDAVEAMRRGAADYLEKTMTDVEQLATMLASTTTPKTAIDPRVRLVLTMIAANPVIDDQSLAAAVDLSVSRVRTLFRDEAGIPLKKHQRVARLDRAAFFLRATNRRISTIASGLGFDDLKHFDHLFAKRHGCTPSQYRQASRPQQ